MTRWIAWPLIALLTLTACGDGSEPVATAAPIGGASGTELADEQVLHRGNGADPATLDPHRAQGVPESNILQDLFEGLVSTAPNGDLEPGAAESWQVSEDGKTYTFKLRADGRWSNGDPVTAHDFVYGLQRSLDPATLSVYTFILAPIVNAEEIAAGELPTSEIGVRALDDLTLEIELENPTPYFLGQLTHASSYPVHRPSVEAHGDQYARPGNLVSNGAYMLDDWVVQSHVKLVRNPHYWDNESTTIDEVYFYATEDQSSELKRYRAGELDMTYWIPKTQLGWIRENLPDELEIAPYLGSYYYGFNLTKPPFKDNLPLRRALSLAIDRDIIAKQIVGAGEVPAYGWIPPVMNYEGQEMPEAAWTQEQREAEAQRLYEQAGYSRDNPLEVEILYNTQEDHKRIAVAIAAMWKEVLGVETSILNQEWKVYLDTVDQFNTEVYRAGWIGDYNDANTFAELFKSDSGQNNTGYASEEYDRLIDLAAAERDLTKRAEHLQEAERVLLDDAPIIPIYYYVTSRLVKPWVGGYEANIMDDHMTKDLYLLAH